MSNGRILQRSMERASHRSPNGPIHTVPDSAGGWTNKREGATRGDETYDTKAAAQAAGREAAMRDKTEHLIHNVDGEIATRYSYGTDHP
jgi:uncharacterized protein DUF2188